MLVVAAVIAVAGLASPLCLRVVRGGLAAPARARRRDPRACRRSSTGSGSPTCPTSISGRPRAGGWRPSGRSPGSRSGGPISSASPVTSSPIRAACRCSRGCSWPARTTVRRARQPRRRNHARPVLARSRAGRPARARAAASRRGRRRGACRGSESRSSGVDAESYPSGARDPGARRRRPPISGCCSATSPRSPGGCPTAPSTSCSPGTCTPARSCFPIRAAASRSRIPRARFVAGCIPRPGGVLHVSPGTGTTFLPFRFFARPEVTELVLARPARWCNNPRDGRPLADLDRHPRELCGRCRARDRRRAGARRGTRPRHHGVKVANDDGGVAVELHLAVDWGVSVPAVGAAVQRRVAEYLGRMADLSPARST